MVHKTQTLHEALSSFRIQRARFIPGPNWKKTLPEGSRWQPGFPGAPDCTRCLGLGYLSLDVSIRHPQFGKLIVCDCVPEPLCSQIRARLDKAEEDLHGKR